MCLRPRACGPAQARRWRRLRPAPLPARACPWQSEGGLRASLGAGVRVWMLHIHFTDGNHTPCSCARPLHSLFSLTPAGSEARCCSGGGGRLPRACPTTASTECGRRTHRRMRATARRAVRAHTRGS